MSLTGIAPRALLSIVVTWFYSTSSSAQSAAPPAQLELTLEAAQRRAAELAPQVRVAEGRIREASASRVGAGVIFPVNPRLSVDARPGLDSETRGSVGVSSSLDLTMEIGGGPGARVREAAARATAAGADAELVRLEARLAAGAAYVAERLAALRIERAQDAVTVAERVLAAAVTRAETGASSDIDVTSARAELAEHRAELHAARAEQKQSEMALRALLAIPAQTALSLSTAIEQPRAAVPIDALVQRAKQRMPDLAAMRAQLAVLRASDQRLSAEAFPKLGAFVGVDASPHSPVFGIAGVSMELPVAQRNQGPRAVVAAQTETELDRYHVTLNRIDLALRGVREAYEAQRAELQVLSEEGVPAAQAHLDLVETGWRAGRFDIFRLTAATQSLVRLKATRIDVLARIWEQRLLLDRITGGFSVQDS